MGKTKLTYAEIAEKLTQSYNKYDKQLQNAVTEAEKNTAVRMLRRVSDRINSLVIENQDAANKQDMKKQAPDSPNLSIGTRTANGYANGGLSPIPSSNKGLPQLPEYVRNKMGYMQGGGQVEELLIQPGGEYLGKVYPQGVKRMYFNGMPYDIDVATNQTVAKMGQPYVKRDPDADYLDRPLNEDGTLANDNNPANTNTTASNGLYDGITMDQISKGNMLKAKRITGIDDFDPTNPDHVKSLQKAMLKQSGESFDFSGQEGDFINDGGSRSVNNAGIDGKFGVDTLTALRQAGTLDIPGVPLTVDSQPTADINIPRMPVQGIDTPIMLDEVVVTGKKPKGEGAGIGKKILGAAPDVLAGLSKAFEYNQRASAISDMQAPAPMNLVDPVYLNTRYNIAPQINRAEDQNLLLSRGLNANSTNRNNVRNNLAGLASGNQRNFNQLYADKFNKESQMQNMQTMANAKANQLNNNIIFDNENAQLDFNNQKREAKARFASALTKDAMDLLTQRNQQRGQQAMIDALQPSWNKYGVLDRQYSQNTELMKLLGLLD